MLKLITTGQKAPSFFDSNHQIKVLRPTVYILKGERQKYWDLQDADVQNISAVFPFAIFYCRNPRYEINGFLGTAIEVHAPKVSAIAKKLGLSEAEARQKLDELAQSLWEEGHPLDLKELRKPLVSTTPSFFSW